MDKKEAIKTIVQTLNSIPVAGYDNYNKSYTLWGGSGGTQLVGGHLESNSGLGVGSFGQGSSYDSGYGSTGGGGGYYGGGTGGRGHAGGGGGSGYIGNSLLLSSSSIIKHMACYNCTTSSALDTNTISNTKVNSTATSNSAKTGNGYAKISFIGTSLN